MLYKMTINGFDYYGRTTQPSIEDRINQHVGQLERKEHTNLLMQTVYNKYKEEGTLEITYVRKVGKDEDETKYIQDTYDTNLNLAYASYEHPEDRLVYKREYIDKLYEKTKEGNTTLYGTELERTLWIVDFYMRGKKVLETATVLRIPMDEVMMVYIMLDKKDEKEMTSYIVTKLREYDKKEGNYKKKHNPERYKNLKVYMGETYEQYLKCGKLL